MIEIFGNVKTGVKEKFIFPLFLTLAVCTVVDYTCSILAVLCKCILEAIMHLPQMTDH